MSKSRLGKLGKLHDRLSFAGYCLGCFALAAIVAIYTNEIVMRYFLNSPTRWGSDAAAFLLLISVFTVMPWLTKEGGHVAVTLVPEMLPERVCNVIVRTGFVIGAVVCVVSVWITFGETAALFDRGTTTLTTIRFPKWIFMAVITYGLFNSAIYFARLAAAKTKSQSIEKPVNA